MAIECPHCGLVNPNTAQRCDCGYDFETQTVQTAYFKAELPTQFRSFMKFLLAYNGVVVLAALGQGYGTLAWAIGWAAAIWWLYSRMLAKKNWARLALAVLTFPVGLLILSSDARLYCFQK